MKPSTTIATPATLLPDIKQLRDLHCCVKPGVWAL
jgi:hypothetical protein